MASTCNRFVNRATLSSLKSAIKSNGPKPSLSRSASAPSSPQLPLPQKSSPPLRRFSLSRSPSELGGVQSLLPLHSTVAAARLTSCLSITSRNSRALSQGTLCCTSPGL